MNKSREVSLDTPVEIEKLVPGGQGLATLPDGKKAFFWNALPGEKVTTFTVTKKKSKYLEAIATEITDPSPHRVEPKDSCYLSTSPWQIMSYDYELAMKSELLREAFLQEKINIEKIKVKTNNKDFFYRNKMEYSLYFDHSDAKIHLAFHRRGSHQKIPIKTSSLERPEIFKKAQEIIADLNDRGEEARKYQSLLLRCDQKGNVSGGLYENGHPHPIFPNLKDTILGHKYSYSPNGFFQINLPIYEMALEEIKSHIHTDKVLDLYAGVGTIGLSVARDKQLTLVEVDKSAYGELVENCARCSILGCAQPTGEPKRSRPVTTGARTAAQNRTPSAILAKSEDALGHIAPDQTVILDPPRAGIDKKLTNKLLETLPETIIYLSCNPSTQARDLRYLTESNKYKITKVQPYNFFPRTPHLENLAILHRT